MEATQSYEHKRLSQDFHGFKVPEFKDGVRKLLHQAQRDGGVNRVTCITGRGSHSPNGAVLTHVLPNLLKKEFPGVFEEVKRDLGAYEIVLKKERSPTLYDETLKRLSSLIYTAEIKAKLVEDARRGLPDVQYQLGTMLLEGIAFEKNEKKGIEWITQAAKTDATAQVLLGYLYEVGKSVSQNYKLSRNWYKKALKQNHPSAAFALGKFYWLGINVIRNDKKGLQLIQKAADLGDSWAAYNFGAILFEASTQEPIDRSQAPKYLEQAAKKGVLPAQVLFAKYCFFGWEGNVADKKALFYFQQAAEAGDLIAQYYCGRCFAEGRGTTKNLVEAIKWYEASAAQGDLDAKLSVAQLRMRRRQAKKKDILDGLKILEELVQQQHSNSISVLGHLYLYGMGPIKPNHEKAVSLLIRAAHNDVTEAQLILARLYISNQNQTVPYEQILTWLRDGAKKEDAEALFYLGMFLDQNENNQHSAEVLDFYTRASNQGHPMAKLLLAMKLMDEELVPENIPTILQLLRESSKKKNPCAQNELGQIYMLGIMVPTDEKLACEYFKKGAKQNFPEAITNLGHCYLFGKGVEQNDQLAVENFLKAAKLGDSYAKLAFARCLLKGRGIKANPTEAQRFLKEAAMSDVVEAQHLLGWIYTYGTPEISAQPAEGLVWLKKAALQGDLASQTLLGNFYMDFKNHLEEAIKWFKMAAAQEDPVASFCLGHILFSKSRNEEAKEYLEKCLASKLTYGKISEMKQISGQTLGHLYAKEDNPELAIKYYKLSPEDPDILYRLGYVYETHENLDPDKSLAIDCLQKAAQQHHLEAQYDLGCVLSKLAAKDPAYGIKAFHWFSMAAGEGHLLASYELGCINLNGEFGQKVDFLKAWDCLLKPAKQGHADSQFLLGCMCTGRAGIIPNYLKGVKWFNKAANQGHLEACFNLAFAYQIGRGIDPDLSYAIKYYLQSAQAGHIKSQMNLGFILLKMNDFETGISWLNKAAAQGSQEAKDYLETLYDSRLKMEPLNDDRSDCSGEKIDDESKNESELGSWLCALQ